MRAPLLILATGVLSSVAGTIAPAALTAPGTAPVAAPAAPATPPVAPPPPPPKLAAPPVLDPSLTSHAGPMPTPPTNPTPPNPALVTDPLKADTGNDSEPIDIAKIEDTLKLTEDLLQSKSIVPPNLPSDTENPPKAEDLDNLNLFNSDTLDNSSQDIPASIGMNIPPPADLENEPSILSTVDPLGLNADSLDLLKVNNETSDVLSSGNISTEALAPPNLATQSSDPFAQLNTDLLDVALPDSLDLPKFSEPIAAAVTGEVQGEFDKWMDYKMESSEEDTAEALVSKQKESEETLDITKLKGDIEGPAPARETEETQEDKMNDVSVLNDLSKSRVEESVLDDKLGMELLSIVEQIQGMQKEVADALKY